LQGLPSLLSLSIWIDLSFTSCQTPHDDGTMFGMLLDSCPRLRHLDVRCFTQPTFHVVSPAFISLISSPHIDYILPFRKSFLMPCGTRHNFDRSHSQKFSNPTMKR
jgi:hypothetical protein